ncbi:MAG TPA: hypothetical protein VLH84_01965 [Patescibacteria group bacterium]|nr:hypothetical protein [Patescibacteria group bacterium]
MPIHYPSGDLAAISAHPRLGGTDGFRDIYTEESGPGRMNAETFEGMTYALVGMQIESGQDGPVIVAQDTRRSGAVLRRAAIRGALAHDVSVLDLGMAPTPTAQKAAQRLGGMATVVATASHNPERPPKQYNGWKGMLGEYKPTTEQATNIDRRYWEQVDSGLVVPASARQAEDAAELSAWYADEVVYDIESRYGEKPLAGKVIVVDGARGAARKLTPAILRRLGATVETFACDEDGYINDICGAENLGGVTEFLAQRRDLIGNPNFLGAFSNDGDADRFMGVGIIKGEDGQSQFAKIDGNHIMGLLAQGVPGVSDAEPVIVGTEYTNGGLIAALGAQGIDYESCPNGDMFVTQRLLALRRQGGRYANARIGGEFTGHHINLDWLSSGDGIRTAAEVAARLASTGRTLGSLHEETSLWAEPMVKVNISPDITDPLSDDGIQNTIEWAKETLGERNVVVRTSGTEKGLVRIWVQSPDTVEAAAVSKVLASTVRDRLAA